MNWKRTTIAALVLSCGVVAGASAQDDGRHDRDRQDQRQYNNNDGYDSQNYQWSQQETPYYRQWYSRTYGDGQYRDFSQISPEEQHRYWAWRHREGGNRPVETYGPDQQYQWSAQETPYYRQWFTMTFGDNGYREYNQLGPDDQRRYWEWRRSHHDDDREHRGEHHDRDDRDRDQYGPH